MLRTCGVVAVALLVVMASSCAVSKKSARMAKAPTPVAGKTVVAEKTTTVWEIKETTLVYSVRYADGSGFDRDYSMTRITVAPSGVVLSGSGVEGRLQVKETALADKVGQALRTKAERILYVEIAPGVPMERVFSILALCKPVVDRFYLPKIDIAPIDPRLAYPAIARQASLKGTVKVVLSVSNGEVIHGEVISGHPVFAEAVKHAVIGWRFPAWYTGEYPITCEFTLGGVNVGDRAVAEISVFDEKGRKLSIVSEAEQLQP